MRHRKSSDGTYSDQPCEDFARGFIYDVGQALLVAGGNDNAVLRSTKMLRILRLARLIKLVRLFKLGTVSAA